MSEIKKKKGIVPAIDPRRLDAIEWKWQNVPYATQSACQVLDIYYPNQFISDHYPVLIYFHGGGFEIGSKDDETLAAMLQVLERGYVLVSVEYRKSQEARFPAALYDAKAAVRFLRANATRYSLDAKKIGVFGVAAGGWIAAMLGVTGANPAFEDPCMGNAQHSSRVDAVVDWNGPCAGFHRMDKMTPDPKEASWAKHNDQDSPESRFMGGELSLIPELCEMANPCHYVSKKIPPFFIIHGGKGEAVPLLQSVEFADALRNRAGEEKVHLYILEEKEREAMVTEIEKEVMDLCLDFFDETLKRETMSVPASEMNEVLPLSL